MNGSPELLEFYLVEATEYVDALDRLVSSASEAPDANALLATARALRGSSTMAKVEPIGELSLAIEQIAIRSRDADAEWSNDLYSSLRSCIDDLRLLIRAVRVWSDREQSRADARLADLKRHLPNETRRPTPPTNESTMPVFVALQAAAIAGLLETFLESSVQRRALDDAVTRSRTLRGIAGITEFPPLADVADAVERAARRLMPDAPISTEERELFQAAAALFSRAAEQLRATGKLEPPAEESARLARAVSALEAPAAPTPPIVRIEQLFFGDEGPHIVQRTANPPTSPEQRLHRELLSRAEHLQRLVGEARTASDPVGRARATRELRLAARELNTVAQSFGAHQVAAFFADSGGRSDILSTAELDALASVGRMITAPFTTLEELEQRVAVLQRHRSMTPAQDQEAVTVAAQAARPAAPTGRELQDLLASGLKGLSNLEREPLVQPAPVEALGVVPIDSLLYSGETALARAIELRDQARRRGSPTGEELEEIFDLLDLARTR